MGNCATLKEKHQLCEDFLDQDLDGKHYAKDINILEFGFSLLVIT